MSKQERQKAQDLRRSSWWKNIVQNTRCYYCDIQISGDEVTMDHVVPITQGGKSTKGNLVPCCKVCNTDKRGRTAVEWYFDQQIH